jgi:hypothetical protein
MSFTGGKDATAARETNMSSTDKRTGEIATIKAGDRVTVRVRWQADRPDSFGEYTMSASAMDVIRARIGTGGSAARLYATSLNDLAAAVFADVDSQRRGNQALAANAAVLVRATNRPIAGTYLLINDKIASLNTRNDLMINITGYAGRLPGLGSMAVDAVFG